MIKVNKGQMKKIKTIRQRKETHYKMLTECGIRGMGLIMSRDRELEIMKEAIDEVIDKLNNNQKR